MVRMGTAADICRGEVILSDAGNRKALVCGPNRFLQFFKEVPEPFGIHGSLLLIDKGFFDIPVMFSRPSGEKLVLPTE